jgi:hypothetical protein
MTTSADDASVSSRARVGHEAHSQIVLHTVFLNHQKTVSDAFALGRAGEVSRAAPGKPCKVIDREVGCDHQLKHRSQADQKDDPAMVSILNARAVWDAFFHRKISFWMVFHAVRL